MKEQTCQRYSTHTVSLPPFVMIYCTITIEDPCRKLFHGLTASVLQVEREMCSASAEFEDFVLQFMDRCVKMCDLTAFIAAMMVLFNAHRGKESRCIFFCSVPTSGVLP